MQPTHNFGKQWALKTVYMKYFSSARCQSHTCSSRSRSFISDGTSTKDSSNYSRSRSPSIPRRYGSPSFLDRRRITRYALYIFELY